MIAYRYDKNKKLVGTQNCQRDPIASVRAGKDIFLLPANCTYIKPLELKDGYDLYFRNEVWEYVEKKKDDELPEEPELTPEQKLKQELSALDREYENSKKELSLAYIDAVMSGDTELQDELKTELQSLNENYDNERIKLENESETED